MRTNIVLDDKLLRQAMRIAKAKTKREAVNIALKEYVQAERRQRAMREMFGSGAIDPAYDYKAARAGEAR